MDGDGAIVPQPCRARFSRPISVTDEKNYLDWAPEKWGAFHFGTIAEGSGQLWGDCPDRMGQGVKVKCT